MKHNSRPQQLTHADSRHSGFTLLELMVASVIAVIILTLIVQVVSSMVSHANRSMQNVSRGLDERVAFQRIQEDLQGIVWSDGFTGTLRLRTSTDGWMGQDWENVPNDTKPMNESFSLSADISEPMREERWGRFGATIELMTQGSRRGTQEPGGIYAVAYRIKRQSLNGNRFPRYYLMRSQISAHQTLETGFRFEGSTYESGSYDPDAVWRPSVIRYPNENHVLIEGVIDFGIRAFAKSASGSGWEPLFPNATGENEMLQKPEMMILMLRVLSDEGTQQIENLEQNRIAGDWWEIANQHSEVYTHRLFLP